MTSGYIRVNPIGLSHGYQIGINESFRSFAEVPKNRVSRNLFGGPKKGEINEIYQQEKLQRIEEFNRKYILLNSPAVDNPLPQSKSIVSPKVAIAPTIGSESRLEESLLDKELREYDMKLKQRIKKTGAVSCDEIKEADRIRFRSPKQQKPEEVSGERPKPYARQQASTHITDYYSQRKSVVRNNCRTPDEHSLDESDDLLSHPIQDHVGIENNSTTSALKSSSHSLSSLSTHQSQEEISLHTMLTDHSAKLA